MAFWVVVTPLPLAFIPSRGEAMLYIVLFGWATIFARMLSDLIGLIDKVSALAGPRTAMLPTFATAAVAVAFAVFTHWESQRFDRTRGLLSSGQKSLHVIQAFRSLDLHPPPGNSILLNPKRVSTKTNIIRLSLHRSSGTTVSCAYTWPASTSSRSARSGRSVMSYPFNEFEAQLVASRNPITSAVMHEALASSSIKVARRS